MAKPVRQIPRALIGFLCWDFAVQTISTETVQALYFCYGANPANSNFATKTAKKRNIDILNSEATRKNLKYWDFTKISKMDEEGEHYIHTYFIVTSPMGLFRNNI